MDLVPHMIERQQSVEEHQHALGNVEVAFAGSGNLSNRRTMS